MVLVLINSKSLYYSLLSSNDLGDLRESSKKDLVRIDIHLLKRKLHVPVIIVIVIVLPPIMHGKELQ